MKGELILHIKELISNRIKDLKHQLYTLQDAANSETKSTAGDKHETARAMAHIEVEKLSIQLNQVLMQEEVLSKINIGHSNQKITHGSLIKTTQGLFFLTIGLGKISFQNKTILVISPLSPIGKLMLNKKEKETFSFNNVKYVIEKIS